MVLADAEEPVDRHGHQLGTRVVALVLAAVREGVDLVVVVTLPGGTGEDQPVGGPRAGRVEGGDGAAETDQATGGEDDGESEKPTDGGEN